MKDQLLYRNNWISKPREGTNMVAVDSPKPFTG